MIVGAGPAGTAAAITLARAGQRVTVIDKAVFPRDKCCGDGLTSGALRHLEELGVRPDSIATWQRVNDVWLVRPSGTKVRYALPAGHGQFAATAARVDLDAALLERAIAVGADVRQGVGLTGVTVHDDRVVVSTDDPETGQITADWCVGADGMWSPTRKALGLTQHGYRGEWHGFRQYFGNVGPRVASDLYVWFEPDLLPGYMWSFPLPDGRANVGFGVLRANRRVQEMAGLWPDLLARPHIRDVLGPNAVGEDNHKAWPIPARIGQLALSAHRVLFAGDAAAACDPLTGEGIGQALQTGMGAARAIIGDGSGSGSPAQVTTDYKRSTERELAIDMRLAAILGRGLATRPGAEFVLWTTGVSDWTRRNFVRWLFEDYPRAVLGTPDRWQRGLFSRPGAYKS